MTQDLADGIIQYRFCILKYFAEETSALEVPFSRLYFFEIVYFEVEMDLELELRICCNPDFKIKL